MNRLEYVELLLYGIGAQVIITFASGMGMVIAGFILGDEIGALIGGTLYILATSMGVGYATRAIVRYEREFQDTGDSEDE